MRPTLVKVGRRKTHGGYILFPWRPEWDGEEDWDWTLTSHTVDEQLLAEYVNATAAYDDIQERLHRLP